MRTLLCFLVVAPLIGQTCTNLVYNNALSQEQQLDYFESPFSTVDSPILVTYHGGGFVASGSTCAQAGLCAGYQEFTNKGINVVHLRYAGYNGVGGAIWPAQINSTRAAFGYLKHWTNRSNQDCTIHGNINDIRLLGFSAGNPMMLWNIVGAQTLWTSQAQYADSGWTVTAAVCMSCLDDFALAYQNGDSIATTAIAEVLGCSPTSGSACADTTAAAATPSLNITQPNVPLLVITGATDAIVTPSVQEILIARLQAAGWTPMQFTVAAGTGTCTASTGAWDKSCHTLDFEVIGTWPFIFPSSMVFDSSTYCPNLGNPGTTGPLPCGESGEAWREAINFLTAGDEDRLRRRLVLPRPPAR